MQENNQRPVCHRAEDLVTYLYGEASAPDALDFRNHLTQCDACRSEFAVFNRVHDSISLWRNEALGASFNPASVGTQASIDSAQFVRHERRLSALAALREFFTVAPLWLRCATAFAGLLLCALVLFTVSRTWQRPASIAKTTDEERVFTKTEFDKAVAREVKIQEVQQDQLQQATAPVSPRTQQRSDVAAVRMPSKPRVKGLTRQEREQLAADLRLVPGVDEEELPFVLPDQPN